jgi:hypothetical protein
MLLSEAKIRKFVEFNTLNFFIINATSLAICFRNRHSTGNKVVDAYQRGTIYEKRVQLKQD